MCFIHNFFIKTVSQLRKQVMRLIIVGIPFYYKHKGIMPFDLVS